MKRGYFLFILVFAFLQTSDSYAVDNNVKKFGDVNLLGVRTGSNSDDISNILERKYGIKQYRFTNKISGATGRNYIDKIEIGDAEDKWLILFTDQTIGGSAAFVNRKVVPNSMGSTKTILRDLINKFGHPTVFSNQIVSHKTIKIRWHYSSNGELMDSLPSSFFRKVDQISSGKKIELLPRKECAEVYTEALRGNKSCEGKDVAVQISTNEDGELLKSLSISIKDYDLENNDIKENENATSQAKRTFLNEAKEAASNNNISF